MTYYGKTHCENSSLLVLSLANIEPTAVSQAQTKLIESIPAKSFGWLPSYVAQEKGFFKAEGLEVIIPVIRSHIGMAALLSGEVHFANASSVMTAAIQEAPVKAIMFYYDRLTWLFMELLTFALSPICEVRISPSQAMEVDGLHHEANAEKQRSYR